MHAYRIFLPSTRLMIEHFALQFGKGVYFADLVSKSAQYCFTDKKNPVGLMLLSEVALGEVYELKKATVSSHSMMYIWFVSVCICACPHAWFELVTNIVHVPIQHAKKQGHYPVVGMNVGF